MGRDKFSKGNLIAFALGLLPVSWIGLLIAPYTEGGLKSILMNIGTAMSSPFSVSFCKDSLLVLFFVMGVIRTCGSFAELKRPELALKLFIRFVIAKAVITYGMDILLAFISIGQGLMRTVFQNSGLTAGEGLVLPETVIEAVEGSRIFDNITLLEVTLIGCLLIWVLSFIMLISVYGRIIRIFMYAAIAPIPLAAFAGESTQNIGKSFLKSFAGVCIEGVIIVLACAIYSSFAQTLLIPALENASSAATIVWNYLGGLLLNMLILVGTVKAADRVAKEMMGL